MPSPGPNHAARHPGSSTFQATTSRWRAAHRTTGGPVPRFEHLHRRDQQAARPGVDGAGDLDVASLGWSGSRCRHRSCRCQARRCSHQVSNVRDNVDGEVGEPDRDRLPVRLTFDDGYSSRKSVLHLRSSTARGPRRRYSRSSTTTMSTSASRTGGNQRLATIGNLSGTSRALPARSRPPPGPAPDGPRPRFRVAH